MMLLKSNLEPYIAPIPSLSTSYLPVLLHPPGLMESIHVCIYLPTHGQDQSFCEELTNISETLLQIRTNHPHVPIYLCEDFMIIMSNMKMSCSMCKIVSWCHVPPNYRAKLKSRMGDVSALAKTIVDRRQRTNQNRG